jgi:4-hydroxy-tetrahydrodipicolinate reductase
MRPGPGALWRQRSRTKPARDGFLALHPGFGRTSVRPRRCVDRADRRAQRTPKGIAMTINVCLAGATGWAGSELARAIARTGDITLAAAVARTHAGRVLGDVLDEPRLGARIFGSAAEALAVPCDVFVEYTRPESAKANIVAALDRGAHVVVGTSGLAARDFAQIDAIARARQRGVLACGNFALTVVLLQKFAEAAARLIPHWEIIDYAHDDKVDAPSGTARELAFRLSRVRSPELTVPLADTVGPREARGATVSGSQVHSLRLPGYVIGAEIVFGMLDQRLTIRHDSGDSARPYAEGALIAIRKVSTLVGVHRGLDAVLDL